MASSTRHSHTTFGLDALCLLGQPRDDLSLTRLQVADILQDSQASEGYERASDQASPGVRWVSVQLAYGRHMGEVLGKSAVRQ